MREIETGGEVRRILHGHLRSSVRAVILPDHDRAVARECQEVSAVGFDLNNTPEAARHLQIRLIVAGVRAPDLNSSVPHQGDAWTNRLYVAQPLWHGVGIRTPCNDRAV